MNSLLRAYQYPCSTDAHVCINPTGSRLSTHIASKPPFNAQNDTRSQPSFHARPGGQRVGIEPPIEVPECSGIGAPGERFRFQKEPYSAGPRAVSSSVSA